MFLRMRYNTKRNIQKSIYKKGLRNTIYVFPVNNNLSQLKNK